MRAVTSFNVNMHEVLPNVDDDGALFSVSKRVACNTLLFHVWERVRTHRAHLIFRDDPFGFKVFLGLVAIILDNPEYGCAF